MCGTIISSYNAGNLEGTTNYGIANSAKATIKNSYYLQGCGATDSNATAVSATELKTMYETLDSLYTIDEETSEVTISETEKQGVWVQDTNNINKGYPILKWQTEQ